MSRKHPKRNPGERNPERESGNCLCPRCAPDSDFDFLSLGIAGEEDEVKLPPHVVSRQPLKDETGEDVFGVRLDFSLATEEERESLFPAIRGLQERAKELGKSLTIISERQPTQGGIQ